MFHGPSLQYLVSARVGSAGYTAVLDADRGRVPAGLLHHGLLDAAMHGVTSRALRQWAPPVGDTAFGFPLRLDSLRLFAPVPASGLVDAEVRFAGFAAEGEHDQPVIDVQLCRGSLVLVDFRVTLVLRPLGRFSHVGTRTARAFTEDGVFVAELLLSSTEGEVTRLRRSDLDALDFLPGTVARVYDLRPAQDALVVVAAKEHVSRRLGVHPRLVEVDADLNAARCALHPDRAFRLRVDRTAEEVAVTSNDTAQRPP
jgi:hypothetical protein